MTPPRPALAELPSLDELRALGVTVTGEQHEVEQRRGQTQAGLDPPAPDELSPPEIEVVAPAPEALRPGPTVIAPAALFTLSPVLIVTLPDAV